MAHTHPPLEAGPSDAQIIEDHQVAGPRNEDKNGSTHRRGRRWHHFRPAPRRRTDLMGVNSKWWMALGWLILILLVTFPFPFWSW